ncbi:hypothetical protein GCM10008908_17020 [Clostridium subterminale]|uniref:DUF4430 domain-containing protein n=1 Tax=Clostridium subterminale TaxID=1550 RepID=A0ABN1KNF9_CLOSU
MSKKMKKFFGFLLVLVMTLAISVNANINAFANANETVNVQIQMNGETYINETVKLNDLKSKLSSINSDHLYSTQPYTNYATEGIKTPTTADALIFAYNQYYMSQGATEVTPLLDSNYPNTEAAISYNWDLKPSAGKPGIYFLYFDRMTTVDKGTVQNPDGTHTWTGDTWTLYVNGVKSNLYSSNVSLTDGMTIIFDYGAVSETW